MFLLICVKTTFLKHFDYWTEIQEVYEFARAGFYACLSILALSTSLLILSVVKSWDFFLLWILLGPCHSLNFLCLCCSDLEREIPNCSEHSNFIFRFHPYISSFILFTFPPSLCPSIHPSFHLKYPSQSRNGSAKCSLIMWCKNL